MFDFYLESVKILLKNLMFNPQNSSTQKLVNCSLGSWCEEFFFFSIFFLLFWTSELHVSQAFWEHQAHPIATPYEPVVKLCSKPVLKFILPVFFEELLHATMWLKVPKG
jgi:hypothetical protein